MLLSSCKHLCQVCLIIFGGLSIDFKLSKHFELSRDFTKIFAQVLLKDNSNAHINFPAEKDGCLGRVSHHPPNFDPVIEKYYHILFLLCIFRRFSILGFYHFVSLLIRTILLLM